MSIGLVSRSGAAAAAVAAPELPAAPFPGIKPFSYEDRSVFFARRLEVRALMRLVVLYRGVLLYGPSQRGKSSLLNAGLIPEAMAHGYRPERIRLQPIPGAECIVDRIRRPVSSGGHHYLPSLFDAPDTGDTIVVSLADLTARLRSAAATPTPAPAWDARSDPLEHAADAAAASPLKPLLIFDQFEEWITAFDDSRSTGTHPAASLQREILRAITELINDHGVRVKVLLSFREDYLPRLDPFFDACPTLIDHYLRLSALAPHRVYKLIRGPFMKYPGAFPNEIAPAVAKAIQRQFVATDPAEICLTELQIVCRSLVEEPAQASLLAPDGPGVRGILQQYFRTRLTLLPDAHRDPAVAILSCLVSGAGTRKTVELDNLLTIASTNSSTPRQVFEAALLALERDARLVRRERRRDLDYFEISSEFLVDWISARAADLRDREEQRRLIAERERAEAEASAMKARLEQQTLRADAEARAADAIRGRLAAETERAAAEATARAQRRLMRWTGCAALLFVALFAVAAAATVFAVRLGHEQVTRLWVQAATGQLGRDPRLSVLLGIKATESARAHSPSMLPAAHLILTRAVRSAGQMSAAEDLRASSPTLSPSGRRLALVVEDGARVEIREGPGFTSRLVPIAAPAGATIRGVRFVNDDDLLVIGTDGAIEVLTLSGASPRRLAILPPPDGGPAAESPQGERRAVDRWAVDRARQRLLVSTYTPPVFSDERPFVAGTRQVSVADLRRGSWIAHTRLYPVSEYDVVLADGGRHYATVAAGGEVRLMEATGRVIASHGFVPGSSIRISADGTFVLGLPPVEEQPAATVSLWQVSTTASRTVALPGRDHVLMALFAPDSSAFSVVQDPGIAQVWDVASRRPLFAAPLTASSIVFSPESTELLAWDRSGLAELWTLRTRKRQLRLEGQHDAVVAAALSPHAGPIVTTTPSTMRVWRRRPDDVVIPADPKAKATTLAISPDGRVVATGRGTQLTLSAIDGRLRPVQVRLTSEVVSVAFAHNGHVVAAGLRNGAVALAGVGADRSRDELFQAAGTPVRAIALSHEGRYVASASGGDRGRGTVVVRDVLAKRVLWTQAACGYVTSLAFGPADRTLAIALAAPPQYSASEVGAQAEPRIRFHVLPIAEPREPTRPPSARDDCAGGLAVQTPGRGAAPVGPPGAPGTHAAPWNAVPEASLTAAAIGDDHLRAISLDPDGALVSWKRLTQPHPLAFDEPATAIAISPHDGSFAVAGESGLVKLYTAEGLLEPAVLQEGGPPVSALVFSAHSHHLASLDVTGAVTIYAFDVERLLEQGRRIVRDRTLEPADCTQLSLDPATCSGEMSIWQVLLQRMLFSSTER